MGSTPVRSNAVRSTPETPGEAEGKAIPLGTA